MTTHQVTTTENRDDDTSSVHPVQPQAAASTAQEDAPAQPAKPSGNGDDDHPELRAKVREKNARTQARGELQNGR